MQRISEERTKYSKERMELLGSAIETLAEPIELSDLTIFTVGSYGRLEASEHSDIDLFFVYGKSGSSSVQRRTNEIRLFGRLIEQVEELDFPALSNDAQYLESHETEDVLKHLGSPQDDSKNYFTTRMLLLLESRCLYGQESYDNIVEEILESYQRDYLSHEDDFKPWFLLNDIMRFWKTLLLNYENKRNAGDKTLELKQRVRSFKLKYSRATTCFATICAIGSNPNQVDIDDLKAIVATTPRERLLRVKEHIPALKPDVDKVLTEYSWFLEQTGLPTDELESHFMDDENRRTLFKRASKYGESLFELVKRIDEESNGNLLRALVV